MQPRCPQTRVLAYDALRAFAIVTVVAIHTLMPFRDILPDTAPVRVLDDLLHYAVPLFVFISGALVWARPWRGGEGAYRDFMRKRAAVIGLPFLAWSAIFLALRFATEPTPIAETPGLLLSGHTWYHLYFVPMLLTFYLFTPAASRIAQRSPELLVVGAYLLRTVAGPSIATVTGDLLGEYGWSWATHVMTHLPHMALGAWFAVRYPGWPSWVRRTWPLLLALGTVVLTLASLGVTSDLPVWARRLVYPGGMAATVLGFALLSFTLEPWLEKRSASVVRAGALAFGVYFVHPLFLFVIFEAVDAGPGDAAWLNPRLAASTFLVVTALSFAASAALARWPSTAWLVGLRRSARDSG